MEKNKRNKNITTNELAGMIKKGFDNTATKQQFEGLENRVGVIEEDLKGVKGDLKGVKEDLKGVKEKLTTFIEKFDEDKLPMRVEYIENTLNLPKKN